MNVLITGAAGNLGGMLARYLLDNSGACLHLLVHKKNLPSEIANHPRVAIFRGDLAAKDSLHPCLKGVECVVHFAGVLFKNNPERFLPETNTQYFRNLCEASIQNGVKRIILISFPHVEGETTPDHPATGRLDAIPESAHARTRLAEEQFLFGAVKNSGLEAVSLRVGMVYGSGVLMVDAARWLAKRRLLGVWRTPTWIHLISKDDFLEATRQAVERDGINGIYHLGDDGHQTLQEFLDIATNVWGCRKPWRMPLSLIFAAARICEFQSWLLGTPSPLTRDFIEIGRCSYYGDTRRMKQELLGRLKYPDFQAGRDILM